ncbi:sugar kinase [Streptomyces tateyamensis]|uniref:Sugar kinase n=1 Tax=Streptomyces tateyamensis TaxID=565073 RepID=A0A2V4NHE3_9ACTN|nr:ROK family protein [Streptomyces tateyamensis]PYC78703.1 sugar kinase [Streptomyces tateyamensis]
MTTGQAAAVAALDVGGTHIKAAVLAADGTVLHSADADTRADRGPEAVLATVLALARALVQEHRPAAVGIAVPGVVDEAAGLCRFAANLGWRDVPVRQRAEQELGLPVALGHDVRAGGLAEARLGAGRDCHSLLFVPVGTGIAGAIVVEGRTVAGAHDGAGELGHLPVRVEGPPCACGGSGCVEAVASASAIARRYRLLAELPEEQKVSAEQVQLRAQAGDEFAARAWREAVAALADGLLTAVTLLDPQRVVIGGGLSRAGAALLDPLRRELEARLTFQLCPELVPAELGHRAGSLGAGLLALDLLAVGAGERR